VLVDRRAVAVQLAALEVHPLDARVLAHFLEHVEDVSAIFRSLSPISYSIFSFGTPYRSGWLSSTVMRLFL
jgi:hypothetical protein